MDHHFQLNDREFMIQFESATLNSELFSHEAHLRLAWLYINAFGVTSAIEIIRLQLLNYVTTQGATDKYNETLTVAAIRIVHHFMLNSETDNFLDFIEENPRLKTNFKALLMQHYDIDVFNSEIAKSTFIEPKVLPFD